jgi:DNA polymerase-4
MINTDPLIQKRKIIHIDMDCFYAAVEMRDNPSLSKVPIAVGGGAGERGVLCTANYLARKFGVHSAMSTKMALKLCPHLKILPVDMAKYQAASQHIREIFGRYTELIEPLSLDEAYLDVTHSEHCYGSATFIAREIRQKILAETGLTASAGIAPNKLLAKIASGWKKPNNQFTVSPNEIGPFMQELPVGKLFGVGKVTEKKMQDLGLRTCHDIQNAKLYFMTHHFGRMGQHFYLAAFGIDHALVEPSRIRKSLSVEQTFASDISHHEMLKSLIGPMMEELGERMQAHAQHAESKAPNKMFIKIKDFRFKSHTYERTPLTLPELQDYWRKLDDHDHREVVYHAFMAMFEHVLGESQTFNEGVPLALRLIGMGFKFPGDKLLQLSLF